MIEELVPDELWERLLRCSHRSSRAAIAIPGGGRSITGPHSLESYSCSRPASPRTSCHLVGRLLRCDLLAAAAGLDRGQRRLALQAQLRALGDLDLNRCAVDGFHVRALGGGITSTPPRSIEGMRAPSTI